jgi:cytochrome c2
MRWLIAILAAVPLVACNANRDQQITGGNARRGKALIADLGCGACHSIPGIRRAYGTVGPPLDNIGDRTILAGMLPNTPPNMVAWLCSPQSVVPGNAMPDLGLTDSGARDVAAYLYTLR